MKLLSLMSLILLVSAGIQSQSIAEPARIIVDQSGQAHPWNHLEVNNSPDNFQFAIVTDRTGGNRPGIFLQGINKLNLLQPEFVMSVGDLIEGYTHDRQQIYREWEEFMGFIEQLEMPFFYVPGNHDYINFVMADVWRELLGPSYYHFIYGDVLFLCLNSEEAMKGSNMGGIEKPQYEYIKKTLEENQDVRWTLVFMHQPLWLLDNARYWKDVEDLLADRKHTVFAGHHHHYVKYERNNGKYFILATTGGVSRLRGPNFGEFDHVAWVTMTDEGPVVANLLLQGIWDENVVTEELQNMIAAEPIRVDPVFTEEGMTEGEVFTIRITNDENVPMMTALKFAEHRFMVPEIVEFQKVIPPNSVEVLEVPVNVLNPLNTKYIRPLRLFSKYLYTLEDRPDVELSSDFGLKPVKSEHVSFTRGEVVVDGRLNEWSAYPYKGNSQSIVTGDAGDYQGDFDGSFEFNVAHDEDFLYVAISVWDDELVADKKLSLWEQDAVRLYLDARPVRESANGRGKNSFEQYLYLNFPVPSTRKGTAEIYQEERLPEALLVKGRKTLQGADIEIAIPVTYLDEMNGSPWKEFRLNLVYYDKDENTSKTGLWWRPDWGSDENYIGSGMFFRQE